MAFYKWEDSRLALYEDGRVFEITFPEKAYGAPVFTVNRRYIAVEAEDKIYIYDSEKGSFRSFLHKFRYRQNEFRFDKNDNLYYIDGNNIGVIDIETSRDVTLCNIGKKQHCPRDLGVSPDGRYVSFRRYRNDSNYLYVFDTKNGELRDCKFSVYHYAWLDDNSIIWSLGGGLKILDVRTGKNQLVVKDHKSLIKRCAKEDAQLFDKFKGMDGFPLFINLDLIKVVDRTVYFSLAIDYFGEKTQEKDEKHYGIWSVDLKTGRAVYHYEFPGDYRKTPHKFFMDDGKLAWTLGEWRIFDGTSERALPGAWEQAIYFNSLNA